jgi:hypothetical protein
VTGSATSLNPADPPCGSAFFVAPAEQDSFALPICPGILKSGTGFYLTALAKFLSEIE